jgi:IS5 family transposase
MFRLPYLSLLNSLVNGYAFLERQSWDNFNEGVTLIESLETYKSRFGVYPIVVLADQIYRTRENQEFCKAHGIRLSGPALGRPLQRGGSNRTAPSCEAGLRRRNAVEDKFGEGKS